MNFIFIIIGYALSISLIAKIILHITLDVANGYKVMLYRSSLLYYLLPYTKVVKDEFERRKKFCNLLQKLVLINLILFIILLVIKNIKMF